MVGITSPESNIDEENLRNKVKGRTRLVKFERTKQGNAVIHRPVEVRTHALIVPQQANYEENLEPVPPLIYVNDAPDSTSDETNRSSLKLKRSSPLLSTVDVKKSSSDSHKIEDGSQKSEAILPFHSATVLSPINEQEEEMETTNGIAFSLKTQDSSTKKYFNIKQDRIPDIITINDDDNDKLSEKSRTIQGIPSSSLTIATGSTLSSEETTQKQKLNEVKQVISYLSTNQIISSLFQISTSTISPSLVKDLSSISNITKVKSTISKEQTLTEEKSSKKKESEIISIKQSENIEPTPITDESFSTQGFEIELENEQSIPIKPESKVIYHKVGGKLKSKKKKKKTKKKKKEIKPKTKVNQIKTSIPPEPLVLIPRRAVPFISATKDKQIDVEEDTPIKSKKKKKRKRSGIFQKNESSKTRCQVSFPFAFFFS